jgi:multidrug efflux pump subunit AcrA (membrane-fusion protein)
MATPTSNPPPSASSPLDDPGARVAATGNAPAVETRARANGAASGGPAVEDGARTNGAARGSDETSTAAADRADTSATATERVAGGRTAGQTVAAAPPARSPTQSAPSPAAAPSEGGLHRAHGPGPAGRHLPDYDTSPRLQARGGKRKRLLLLFPILLIALAVAATLGYRYWYQTTYFVSTENASITGDLVQVGSLNAGRIVATRVDVGRPVRQGQEIAVVAMPQEVGSGVVGAAPRMGITGTSDSLVPVYSPLNGIVAARMGHVGGTVTAGQPIYALVDPAQVWIRANIEESNAWRVQVGQAALIHVDALNRDFVGYVDAITPASAATFSLLPANNASGNFTKVTQYVPVKIIVDTRGVVLPLGTSVEVRIQVREPGSEWPLPWSP